MDGASSPKTFSTVSGDLMKMINGWILLGLAGQLLFFCRFLIQWVASERKKQVVIPVAFWYCSLGGGAILLIYAIWRRDPVFILGQGAGLFIYIRNLILRARHKKRGASELVG